MSRSWSRCSNWSTDSRCFRPSARTQRALKASLHPPLRSGRNRDGKCFPWNIRSPFSLRAFFCCDRFVPAGIFLLIFGAMRAFTVDAEQGERGKYDGRHRTRKWNKNPQTGCGFSDGKIRIFSRKHQIKKSQFIEYFRHSQAIKNDFPLQISQILVTQKKTRGLSLRSREKA